MEVHHHSHEHEKKNWKSYFWEFLMLFLAVFCGFLAENFREHQVEHQREKIFAGLLLEDLKKDSEYLDRVIMIKQTRNRKLDSLKYFLSMQDIDKNATAIYYYSSFIDVNIPFTVNDATIQQLRSSGTLRYFTNAELYNAITQYYTDCEFYREREKENSTRNIISGELQSALFDPNDFASLTTITPDILDAVKYPEKRLHMLSNSKNDINKFLLIVNNTKKANELSIMLLQNFIEDELKQLITRIASKFNLE